MHPEGSRGFPRETRLLSKQDFRRIFDSADCKASHQNVLLLAARNQLNHSRLGIIVAKKNVRLAVNRNRFKRVTRETFRNLESREENLDVIVMARRGADKLDNSTLSSILRQQWQKLLR
ncbi:MAG: ribonuclease P protein component [Halieaceae bacterium]|jgi:ribonuclease P protein component|nr:ribonuclease P protein component [Halieaceae bacterium]